MNSKVIAGIVILIVIIGGAFLLTRDKGSDVASNNEAVDAESSVDTESASIKSLLTADRNQTCTFTSTEGDMKSEGTVYVSGGKMRGDFSTTTSGQTNVSHMIHKDNTNYMWTEGQTTGLKMTFDPKAVEAASEASSTQNQSVDPNKNLDFDCDSWSADNSKFELPSGVTFSELPTLPGMDAAAGAGAAAGASGSADTKAMQQAICNNLSEPAKSQCLANMPN
jgi:hypothetical protein